ncbi:MAG TPA: aa3-type cytochrome c oxidase subunit IV [Beijerinckiaceae bacterium]|mgnify:CR=1 FL=1|nr:aa3-type cytochrome c oxidase subunit IV [Beijerinckiaceae bacterium]
MADQHAPHNVDNDYVEHEKTYELFLTLTKWGTIATVILVLFIGSMTSLVPWALTLFLTVAILAASRLF